MKLDNARIKCKLNGWKIIVPLVDHTPQCLKYSMRCGLYCTLCQTIGTVVVGRYEALVDACQRLKCGHNIVNELSPIVILQNLREANITKETQ